MTQISKALAVTGEWECTECGYTIEGTQAKRPARCPECDAPADALQFFANDDDVEDDWTEDEEESDALDDDDYEDDDDDYDEDLDDEDDDDEFDDDDGY